MSTRSGPGPGRPDPGLGAIMSERRQLINLAYRLLGSLTEAEDAVQEAYARWYAMSPTARQAGLVRDFKAAWEAKDIHALIDLLDPDATATGDGGGLVRAELRPIEGAEQIARFYVDLAGRGSAITLLEQTVNGQPGLVAQLDGATVAVYAFDVAGGRIKHIWAILNPDKLRPWTKG
jgi:hypothetical protein